MFTGIVQSMGEVVSLKKRADVTQLALRNAALASSSALGDSIAVNGICLTVVRLNNDIIYFDVSSETMKTTDMSTVATGTLVNLEPAMGTGSLFGGHFVTGHVDGVGTIKEKRREGDYTVLAVEAEDVVTRYIVTKGSITIDGISLTVVSTWEGGFTVGIIPHTMQVTTLGTKQKGDKVNLETDIIGKYVEKFVIKYTESSKAQTGGSAAKDESLIAKLKEEGYMK